MRVEAITPPVGTIMYVVCALSKITIGAFSREVWVFVLALWLPNLVLPAK